MENQMAQASTQALPKSYTELETRFRRFYQLNDLRSIVAWDEAVMMPPGSGDARGEAIAEMGVVMQNLIASPEIGDWLSEAESQRSKLNDWQNANIKEMRRMYIENTAIPADLNQRWTMARIRAEQSWRKLRGENGWKEFQPYLQEVLTLSREAANVLGSVRGMSVYDASLSMYSNGLNTKTVSSLFGEIRSFLPQLIQQVIESQKSRPAEVPRGKFPIPAQKALCEEMMTVLGFDTNVGRLDVSHHPFCGGNPNDVRITTRYSESEFVSSLTGVLHETGHALYEQNLPRGWVHQPAGQACGMAIHESQSLFMEMQIIHSREFLEFAAPVLRKHMAPFIENPKSLETDNLIRVINHVQTGLIRVDADEVTYPMHIILRFEIERDLLEDKWPLAELPEVWNTKMQEYLGLSTKGDFKNGCMQDVHWPSGSFGYFPAYTFGAVIAAQLFAKMQAERPSVKQEIRSGEFKGVRTWLGEKIWSQGSRYNTLELVEKASGPLGIEAFRTHLKSRYA
jgi:carboxypeptidase Taq